VAERAALLLKLSSLAFLALLCYTHVAAGTGLLLAMPLSMFRDGPLSPAGYLLFAFLTLIGITLTLTLAGSGRRAEAGLAGAATGLLVVVAATPTYHAAHEATSFGLLFALYCYVGCLATAAGRTWFYLHLATPAILLLATQFHSYGLWQKSYVVYVIVVANVYAHLVRREAIAPPRREYDRRAPTRRRKVYTVDPGRVWAVRRGAGTRG
jgi:hypothetical protein